MTKYLLSPQGLRFLAKSQLLQTGNAISETRIINPLFINLNLTPHEHFKRQLRDQTDISLGSESRSPASTPNIGVAGRLQIETSKDATAKITNRPNVGKILSSVLGVSQLVNLLAGTLGIGASVGTLRVDERPEFDVGGKLYSVILREGFEPFASRELGILMGALRTAGTALSIIGIPNIFRGIGLGRGANPIPSQTTQMRYFITNKTDAIRYIDSVDGLVRKPGLFTATSIRLGFGGVGIPPALNIPGVNLPGISSPSSFLSVSLPRRSITQLPIQDTIQILNTNELFSRFNELRNNQSSTVDKLTFPEDALENRYTDDDRLKFVRDALKEQAELVSKYTGRDAEIPNMGIQGGITLKNLQRLNEDRAAGVGDFFAGDAETQNFFQALPRREIGVKDGRLAPGYYHDTLNLKTRFTGSLPTDDPTFPVDLINVTILDKVNNRLEPFRAIIESIDESINPEFNETRYIGRIERNIVYLGATRTLTVVMYVNAWSPRELQAIWDKVNFISGLAFPSNTSSDGFLLPPIVELTIGDLYKDQPGYFSQITHTFHDETVTWEIEPGSQVPKVVKMNLTFEVIEKESMTAASAFYGFGVPLT